MFEELFDVPSVIARHSSPPYEDERHRYLLDLAIKGHTLQTRQSVARELLVIAGRIDLSHGRAVCTEEIEAAANQWAAYQVERNRAKGTENSRAFFLHTATDWLKYLGRLRFPEVQAPAFAGWIADFSHYMNEERGLSPYTVRNNCQIAACFLRWFEKKNREFAQLSTDDLDAFFAWYGPTRSRRTVKAVADGLRSFFIHAEKRGWCAPGIATTIEGPPVYRREGLPPTGVWDDVTRLVASTETDRAVDIRNRAILMLFAEYGFRSGEVSRLRLEDFDWEREVVSVRRPKPRRIQQYPLKQEVGDAILRYLKEVRPRSTRREVFLTLQAPFRPISLSGLWHVTRDRLFKLGINWPRRGPHSLRHACASHLLSEGLSFKEIGDHLGHSSAESTKIYAKVDVAGLREVARHDLGGLL